MESASNQPPPPSAQLDPLETDPQHRPIELRDIYEPSESSPGERFRHSSWSGTRKHVYRALKKANAPGARIGAFCSCGRHAKVIASDEILVRYRVTSFKCKDRWCIPCSNERANLIARNLRASLGNGPYRFVTLTLKASPAPLKETIAKLKNAWSSLRRRKLWTKRVSGGCAFMELTRGSAGTAWHVHLHVICEGLYLPHKALCNTWKAITGDSFIVDVRLAKGPAQVASYCAKYASKPLHSSFSKDPEALQEAVKAMKGVPLCQTFGTWRGLKLTQPTEPKAWKVLGRLDDLIELAERGHRETIGILAELRIPELAPILERARKRPPYRPPECDREEPKPPWYQQYLFEDHELPWSASRFRGY